MKTTHLLIALNLLIYAAMLGVAGTDELRHFSTRTLMEFGAFEPRSLLAGQWWRLINAMFMHLTPQHIAMNMIALYQAGPLIEEQYGRARFVALYLVAGLVGWGASLVWGVPLSAGASGALCGLIGAGIAAGHLQGGPHGHQVRDMMLKWAAIVLVLGYFIGANNAAHLGGLGAGAALAWLFEATSKRRARPSTGFGLESILLVALVGGSFALAGRDYQRTQKLDELISEGVALSRADKHAEATEKFRRAITVAPNEPVAHFDLAVALLAQADWAGAESAARDAIALDAQDKNAFNVLYHALKMQKKDQEAAAARARFLELGGVTPAPDAVDGGGPD